MATASQRGQRTRKTAEKIAFNQSERLLPVNLSRDGLQSFHPAGLNFADLVHLALR